MKWTHPKTTLVAGASAVCAAGIGILVLGVAHSLKTVHLPPGVLPRTLPELNAWYDEPPAAQNAAVPELKGIAAMQIANVDQNPNLPVLGKLPPPWPPAPLSSAVKSAMADFTEHNQKALQCFMQGAKLGCARYPMDLTAGPDTKLPHLIGVKRGMQTAEICAIFDADGNDGQRAAEDILAALGLARSLKTEPVLISQLVRAAGVAIAGDALNQVVNRTTIPATSLDALARSITDLETCDAAGEGFDRAFLGEKVMNLAYLKSLEEPKAKNKLMKSITVSGREWGLNHDQQHRMIEYLKRKQSFKPEQDDLESTYRELKTAHDEAFPERLKDFSDVLHRRVAEATENGFLLSSWWFEGNDKSVRREASCLANLRLDTVAVALEEFRAAQGNGYPDALSALVPTYLQFVPADPFDGQPMRYRKEGTGYLLYSIGPDLKDDGGRRMTNNVGDMTFTVITAPAL